MIERSLNRRRGRWTRAQVLTAGLGAGAAVAAGAGVVGARNGPDAKILNLFLLLERVQESFYREALAHARLEGGLLAYAKAAAQQERAHVAYLTQRLGGAADAPPRSDFGDAVRSAERFRSAAVDLEEAAIAAYIGQAARLERDTVARIASLVAVEARQAAWIRDLAGENPAPRAADPAAKAGDVLADLRKRGWLR